MKLIFVANADSLFLNPLLDIGHKIIKLLDKLAESVQSMAEVGLSPC